MTSWHCILALHGQFCRGSWTGVIFYLIIFFYFWKRRSWAEGRAADRGCFKVNDSDRKRLLWIVFTVTEWARETWCFQNEKFISKQLLKLSFYEKWYYSKICINLAWSLFLLTDLHSSDRLVKPWWRIC